MTIEHLVAIVGVGVILGALAGCTESHDSLAGDESEVSERKATEPAEDAGADAPVEAPAADAGKDAAPQACTISFEKNVLPSLGAAGCASTQCHGTRFGPAIRIELKDADLTYEELTTFKLDGKPYVRPGANDAEASAIHCHLAGKCGAKMPPLGGTVPPTLIASVERWLQCGAPKN